MDFPLFFQLNKIYDDSSKMHDRGFLGVSVLHMAMAGGSGSRRKRSTELIVETQIDFSDADTTGGDVDTAFDSNQDSGVSTGTGQATSKHYV